MMTFCSQGGRGLTSQTCLRLGGMLDGLVNVGKVDCTTQDNFCTSLDIITSTTACVPPGAALNNKEKVSVSFLNSWDAKEIYFKIMYNLPGFHYFWQTH